MISVQNITTVVLDLYIVYLDVGHLFTDDNRYDVFQNYVIIKQQKYFLGHIGITRHVFD